MDVALLLMVLIWGSNFSIVKVALTDFPELPFNAWRLALASAVLLGAWSVERRRMATRGLPLGFAPGEWVRVVLLGVVGHLVYQLCFVGGVARTSASNSALIFGCTPVAVALLAWMAGHERVTALRWAGAGLSLAGVYILIGHGAAWSGTTLGGDLLVLAAMLCWSLYSVAAQPLLVRHSPLAVTAWSMVVGAVLYAMVAAPAALATDWRAISLASWGLMIFSSVFALAVAYIIWYTGVRRLGSSRTALYSNLTPLVAVVVAAIWLGEPIAGAQMVGAGAILGGVFVARLGGPSETAVRGS